MKSRKVRPTPERVERMLIGERALVARLEAELADARERVAKLEALAKKMSDD